MNRYIIIITACLLTSYNLFPQSASNNTLILQQKESLIGDCDGNYATTVNQISSSPCGWDASSISFPFGYISIQNIIASSVENEFIEIDVVTDPYGSWNEERHQLLNYQSCIAQWCSCMSDSESQNLSIYEQMNKRHQDTLYHKADKQLYYPCFYGSWDSDIHTSLFPLIDIQEITVTSNKRFDRKHPVGTSLNDILTFTSQTPMPYISSGYNDSVFAVLYEHPLHIKNHNHNDIEVVFKGQSTIFLHEEHYRVSRSIIYCKLMNDLEPEDLMLLGGDIAWGKTDGWTKPRITALGFLRFIKSPSRRNTHILNIHIVGFNGKEEVTYDIPVIFAFS